MLKIPLIIGAAFAGPPPGKISRLRSVPSASLSTPRFGRNDSRLSFYTAAKEILIKDEGQRKFLPTGRGSSQPRPYKQAQQ